MANRVLIVDDETSIRQLLRFNLEKSGYEVIEAETGTQAMQMVKTEKVDLIILDLMLPELDGLDVCRLIKSERITAGIPIIMLTAKNDELDTVLGLELGADDYMSKPFSPRELMARIKVVLRRSLKENVQEGELTIGKLRMSFHRYEAFLGKVKLDLTPKEYELLKLFVTNVGKAYSREQLLEKIWGYEYFGDTRTVDVHVRHLRAKLAQDSEMADVIETVRGVGYRFREC